MSRMLEREKKWLLVEKYGVKNERDLVGEKSEAFFADLKRLKNGEPLAFVIGFVDFLTCKIDLKYKPLIPRPETEYWVNIFIKNNLKNRKNKNGKVQPCSDKNANNNYENKIQILDLFSGSGCIGISILKKCQNCQVDFGEKNPKFIKQIKKNLKLNLTKNRASCYKIFKTDIFSGVPKNKKYDFILTNPPYIPKNKKNTVQTSVLNYEDYSSLFADDNGLFFVKKIIKNGFNFLKPNGKIYIEFDHRQKKKIEEHLKKNKIKFNFQKDQYKKYRVLILFT